MKTATTLTIVLMISAANANAGFFSKREAPAQSTEAPLNAINLNLAGGSIQSETVLKELASDMTLKLDTIQSLIDSNSTKEALQVAKATLDEVRVKSGIDPKVQMREKFLAPVTFADGARSTLDLSEDQKNTVISTVRDFRGGMYIDIVNLTKRTTLLYIKAFHAEIKKTGGMMQEDRDKIIRDLAMASLIAIPVMDKKGQTIIVYDDQFANEDHVYMFNREIKLYLISSKDLEINEKTFVQYRNSLKVVNTPKKGASGYQVAMKCMYTANNFGTHKQGLSASISCFDRHLDRLETIEECRSVAIKIPSTQAMGDAAAQCINKFAN